MYFSIMQKSRKNKHQRVRTAATKCLVFVIETGKKKISVRVKACIEREQRLPREKKICTSSEQKQRHIKMEFSFSAFFFILIQSQHSTAISFSTKPMNFKSYTRIYGKHNQKLLSTPTIVAQKKKQNGNKIHSFFSLSGMHVYGENNVFLFSVLCL